MVVAKLQTIVSRSLKIAKEGASRLGRGVTLGYAGPRAGLVVGVAVVMLAAEYFGLL